MSETVKPGQIWADNDPRSAGRTLRVERIEGTKAACTILTNATAVQAELDSSLRARRTTLDRRGRTARISLARFRPTSTGYRLLAERPEADASDVCGSAAPSGPAYFCEKPSGHSGDHSGEHASGVARHTWPAASGEAVPPEKER
jgi:hypothetical protein